jgi:hypothetical protein
LEEGERVELPPAVLEPLLLLVVVVAAWEEEEESAVVAESERICA